MYGHRQQAQSAGGSNVGSRIPDLLEALRGEYEVLQQECSFLKHHRDDVDSKSIQDIGMVHKVIQELEKAHLRMKLQYEEEIRKLKLELEACQRPVNNGQPSALSFHPLPRLEQEMQAIGSSFLATPVPGVPESANTGHYIKRSSDNDHVRISKSEEQIGVQHSTGKIVGSKSHEDATAYTSGHKDSTGGYDWLVVYNPKVQRSLTVNLNHTLTHDGVVCAVRFDPTGKVLATGSNKAVRLYDVKTGNVLATLSDAEMEASPQEDQFFRAVAFSPNGKILASGSEDSVVRVWDVDSQKLLFRLAGHEQDIYSVEFFDNGDKLATGSGDKTVKLWDLKTQKCLNTLYAGTPDSSKDSGITSISVSPNGKFLAAGSLDRLVRIWSLPSGAPVDIIEGHQDSIYSINFIADGKHLLSGSLDKTVRLWEFESEDYLKGAQCKFDMIGHKDFVLSVTGSPDSRWFLTGSKDRSVQCWDRATGSVQFMLQGHKNSVIGIAYSPAGNVFATASGDFRARIWSFDPYEPATPTTGEAAGLTAKMRRLEADGDESMENVEEQDEETGEDDTNSD